ncbi:MAG: hypothetical protein ACHP65_05880 [Legionellales bacterium]
MNSFRGLGIKIFEKQKYSASDRFFTNQKVFEASTKGFTKDGIFALQEIEDAIVPNLKRFWNEHNYKVIVTRYNPDKMSLSFVFAYDPAVYDAEELPQVYLTKNGLPWQAELGKESEITQERIEHNLGNDHTRSSQMIQLTHKGTGKTVVISSNHFALLNNHKLMAAEKLCNELEKIKYPLIVLGDFNQFDKTKVNELFPEQIDIFKKYGFCWESEELSTKTPGATFLPYPYDILFLLPEAKRNAYKNLLDELTRAEKGLGDYDVNSCRESIRMFFLGEIKTLNEEGKSLLDVAYDAVFTKNMPPVQNKSQVTKTKVLFFEQGQRVKPCPSREEINRRATKLYCEDAEAPYSSDHFPVKMSVHI